MAVVRVGQLEAVDERLVAGHVGVRQREVHERLGAREVLRREIGALAQHCAEALLDDLVAPVGLDHAGPRDADEQIAKRCREEHACVIDDDERHGAIPSVPEVVLLRLGGQLFEGCLRVGILATLVLEDIRQLDPTVRANLAMRDLAFLE